MSKIRNYAPEPELEPSMMPPPPDAKAAGLNQMGVSPVRGGVCIHGVPTMSCGDCSARPPSTLGPFSSGPAKMHSHADAEAVAKKIHHIDPDLLAACPPAEAKRRAAKILKELAPQPAKGHEQPQRHQYESEEESSYEEEEEEEVSLRPPIHPKRYWTPKPSPYQTPPPLHPEPRQTQRHTLTPMQAPQIHAATQATPVEDTGVQTTPIPTPKPTPRPTPKPSPKPTPKPSTVPSAKTPTPVSLPAPMPVAPISDRSVFGKGNTETPYVPITLPHAPVAAAMPTPPRRCGHEERSRRRAEQRAAAAIAAAEQKEKEAAAYTLKKEQEAERLLEQAKRERLLAEQAAVHAIAQREGVEAVLQQASQKNKLYSSDMAQILQHTQEQNQQALQAATRERMAAQNAAALAAQERQALDATMAGQMHAVAEGNKHAMEQINRQIKKARSEQKKVQESAAAVEDDRVRAENAVKQAGDLVDAALKILSAAQPGKERRDVSPGRGAPVAPQVHERYKKASPLVVMPPPKRAESTNAPVFYHGTPVSTAAPSPSPDALRTHHNDDAISEVSKGFTADRSVVSDGPSPPDGATVESTATTSMPSIYQESLPATQQSHQLLHSHSRQQSNVDKPASTLGGKPACSGNTLASKNMSANSFICSAPQSSQVTDIGQQVLDDRSDTVSAFPSEDSIKVHLGPNGTYIVPAVQNLMSEVVGLRHQQSEPVEVAIASATPTDELLEPMSQLSAATTSLPSVIAADEREESPPPVPESSCDSPPISPSEVHGMTPETSKPRKKDFEKASKMKAVEAEVSQALQDAMNMVRRAETAEAVANAKAEAMSKRTQELEARLHSAIGPSYTVGALDLRSEASAAVVPKMRTPMAHSMRHYAVTPGRAHQAPAQQTPPQVQKQTPQAQKQGSHRRDISPARKGQNQGQGQAQGQPKKYWREFLNQWEKQQ